MLGTVLVETALLETALLGHNCLFTSVIIMKCRLITVVMTNLKINCSKLGNHETSHQKNGAISHILYPFRDLAFVGLACVNAHILAMSDFLTYVPFTLSFSSVSVLLCALTLLLSSVSVLLL
jgi:hypothetical protein